MKLEIIITKQIYLTIKKKNNFNGKKQWTIAS